MNDEPGTAPGSERRDGEAARSLAVPPMHASVRVALVAGVAVPVLYFGAQMLAAPFFPGYSVLEHPASLLGSDRSSLPVVLNAGAALTGAAALAAAYGLHRALRARGAGQVVAALVAACSVSMGLSSLWAATHPMPDPRHNPGALGAGMFAAPFVALVASFALRGATRWKTYFVANAAGFLLVAALYSGLVPLDLRRYGGAVQRLGALVMFVPFAVLCAGLLGNERPGAAGVRPSTSRFRERHP